MFGDLPGTYSYKEAVELFGDYLPTQKDVEELEKAVTLEEYQGLFMGNGLKIIHGKVSERQKTIPCYMDAVHYKDDSHVPTKAFVKGREGFILFENTIEKDCVDYLVKQENGGPNLMSLRAGFEWDEPLEFNLKTEFNQDKCRYKVKLVFRP